MEEIYYVFNKYVSNPIIRSGVLASTFTVGNLPLETAEQVYNSKGREELLQLDWNRAAFLRRLW